MIVIVTNKCYLHCHSVESIEISPDFDWLVHNKEYLPKYQINISFRAKDPNAPNYQPSRDDMQELRFTVIGEKVAHQAFKDIVSQIREQCPDQVYLNTMFERMLSGETEEIKDDPRTETIKRPRRTESLSKALLQKSRRSSKRRR